MSCVRKNVTLGIKRFNGRWVHFGTWQGHEMVSGAAHTTQHTILPALQFIKTKPNSSVVSSIFLCA
jgi:phosphate acetyltransferase